MEMPRSFSIAIQSEVTPRRPALPCTAPAVLIAAACSASASVSVDLPASGWLITAKVRRRAASSRTTPSDADRFSTSVTDTAAVLLTHLLSANVSAGPRLKQEKAQIHSPKRSRGPTPTHNDRTERATEGPARPGSPGICPARLSRLPGPRGEYVRVMVSFHTPQI